MVSTFFKRLNYSFGNEDWKTEQQALQLKPDDRVLCITGSGDRPLHLLLSNCQEVVSIDANPIQNHLLTLKAAAMQRLLFSEYLSFLGAHEGENREKILAELIKEMGEHSAIFWQQNKKMVKRGVLYQGAVERLCYTGSSVMRFLCQGITETLFQMNDVEEQKRFVESHWDKLLWKKFFHYFLHPRVTRFVTKDPGLYTNLTPSLNIGAHIYGRIKEYLHHFLAKESLLLCLILKGRVMPEAYPPYLLENEVETIKGRVHRLSIVTEDLVQYLEKAPEGFFGGFSLSDVASYFDEKSYVRLLQTIVRAAKPGARFCLRQFLSCYEIPKELQHHFLREPALEQQLQNEDRCFVYRFMVGTIAK